MEKSKRKEILKAIKEKELAEFRQNLPMPEDKFIRLFELLDAQLHARGCDHDLKLTEQILSNLDVKDILSVLARLKEQGGYTGCEVMMNVEQKFEYLEKKSTQESCRHETKRYRNSNR